MFRTAFARGSRLSVNRLGGWIERQTELCEEECRSIVAELSSNAHHPVVVDLGCGNGALTARVAAAASAQKAVGVDVVQENAFALKQAGLLPVLSDLDRGVPLRNECADLVVLSHIIEHVADTDGLVQECYRILKPGGTLIVATPNLAALANIVYLILGKQPAVAEVSDVALVGTFSARGAAVGRLGPAHRRMFTKGALVGLLAYYGFTAVRVVMQGFLPLPTGAARIASKVLPRYAWNIVVQVRK